MLLSAVRSSAAARVSDASVTRLTARGPPPSTSRSAPLSNRVPVPNNWSGCPLSHEAQEVAKNQLLGTLNIRHSDLATSGRDLPRIWARWTLRDVPDAGRLLPS